jgi:propanol-preferring alcohol dehydrogenase
MSDIPAFPYELLWGERSIRSVANLTRQDGEDFFRTIAPLKIRTKRKRFALYRANEALQALRAGAFSGTAVLTP